VRKAETAGIWIGAVLKIFGAWAAVHIAFVADHELRLFRVLGGVLIFLMIREQAQWARLRLSVRNA
jgi:hypothetical protein